ncbi:hypothetical protein [Hellea balneolensis]|uniref:hypothetical protein n=1 Tax=Hellea balneolensis TaxID=287478 RepID=UPI00040625DD|nr:hypothetical protein [Hellea balneolensis]
MKRKAITFKKRYIVFGLLAAEIAAIPVAAKALKDFKYEPSQRTVAVAFPSEQLGVTKFLVSSNAPFAIISKGDVGQFDVAIKRSGELNGRKFGTKAQMPGAAEHCAVKLTTSKAKIYEATRKIDAGDGDVLSRAVIVEIRYAKELKSEFEILSENKAKKYDAAASCAAKLS